jgi:hypothetical protein
VSLQPSRFAQLHLKRIAATKAGTVNGVTRHPIAGLRVTWSKVIAAIRVGISHPAAGKTPAGIVAALSTFADN